MVHIRPNQNGLGVRFVYDTGLFTRASMLRLALAYQRLLVAALAEPTLRVDELASSALSEPAAP